MDSIIELLNLEDPNIIVSDISIEGNTKFVTLETKPSIHFCPRCCYRMHSKGIRTRKVNHPILQDTYSLILVLKQRRWKCTNTECGFESNESFNFVKPVRRNTNAADFLIVDAFRDINATASSIAKRFNTTDTNVLDIFDRYVHLDRLPLTDAVSVVDSFHVIQWIVRELYTFLKLLMRRFKQRDEEKLNGTPTNVKNKRKKKK